MRTTLTLDDDVAAAIERLREKQGKPLKAVINEVLRKGLSDTWQAREPRAQYHTRVLNLGRCHLPNVDDVADTLSFGEGEDHR